MNVLVTGGAGFIGSHLCDALHGAGHHVICLDDLSTGSASNIAHLQGKPRFEFLEHNLIHPIVLAPARIFHLACPASPVAYQRNPVRTVKANVLGTINVLGMARKAGARVLLASTSEVYGDPAMHPQREDYQGNVNQLGPRACYDEGKRVAETLMMDYHRQHGVDVRIARIFNTYGPRMAADDGRVVSNFIMRALRNEPAQLYGGGVQSRSFCYIDDMVSGLLRLMDYEGPHRHQPFNLGNPQEITIRQLAAAIYARVGADAPPVETQGQQDDPSRRCPDITRAMTEGVFEARTPLDDGLKQTIEWFRRATAS